MSVLQKGRGWGRIALRRSSGASLFFNFHLGGQRCTFPPLPFLDSFVREGGNEKEDSFLMPVYECGVECRFEINFFFGIYFQFSCFSCVWVGGCVYYVARYARVFS